MTFNASSGATPAAQSRPRPTGPLNGRYHVSCPYVELNFPEFSGTLGLTVTLDNNLWLSFDIGIAKGMGKTMDSGKLLDEWCFLFWHGMALDISGGEERSLRNWDTLRRRGPFNFLIPKGDGYFQRSMCYGSKVQGSLVIMEFDTHRYQASQEL